MRLALEIIWEDKKILERVCVAPMDCVLRASYCSSLSHYKNVPRVGRLRQCPLPRAAFTTWLERQWNRTTGLPLEPPCPDAPKLFRPGVFGWKEQPGGSWSCFRLVSPDLCLPWVGTQSQTSACTSWCTPWSCVWRFHCIQDLQGFCKTSVPCSSPHESAVSRNTHSCLEMLHNSHLLKGYSTFFWK